MKIYDFYSSTLTVISPSFKINITYIFVFRNEVLWDDRFEADDGKIVIGIKMI